jgi:hypothetical protein
MLASAGDSVQQRHRPVFLGALGPPAPVLRVRHRSITVAEGKNLLLRLGNLSANVAYWLELVKIENENKETKIPLTVLSLDMTPRAGLRLDLADDPLRVSQFRWYWF